MERSSGRTEATGLVLAACLALGACAEGDAGDGGREAQDVATGDRGGLPAADGVPAGPNFTFAVSEAYANDPSTPAPFVARLETFLEGALAPLQRIPGLMPRTVSVRYDLCGEANSFHFPATDTIVLCHELAEHAFERLDDGTGDTSNDPEGRLQLLTEQVLATMGFMLYHEIAHALDFQRDLPIVGNVESAMDSIATVIAVETGQYLYALGGGLIFLDQPPSLTGRHGGGVDRSGDINCWTTGGEAFVQVAYVSPLVAEVFDYGAAGRDCEDEYADLRDAVRSWIPGLARVNGGSLAAEAAVAAGTSTLVLRFGPRWLENADPGQRRRVERLFARFFAPVEDIAAALPERIDVVYESCGAPTSSYDAVTRTVTLCQELVEHAYRLLVDQTRATLGREPNAAEKAYSLQAAYRFLGFSLYHEVGHAVHASGHVPGTEPVESAADAIAALLLVESGMGREAFFASLLVFEQPDEQSGLHGDGTDRGPDLLCLTLGGDAAMRGDPNVPPSLIEEYVVREPSCIGVYERRRDEVLDWLSAS